MKTQSSVILEATHTENHCLILEGIKNYYINFSLEHWVPVSILMLTYSLVLVLLWQCDAVLINTMAYVQLGLLASPTAVQ